MLNPALFCDYCSTVIISRIIIIIIIIITIIYIQLFSNLVNSKDLCSFALHACSYGPETQW